MQGMAVRSKSTRIITAKATKKWGSSQKHAEKKLFCEFRKKIWEFRSWEGNITKGRLKPAKIVSMPFLIKFQGLRRTWAWKTTEISRLGRVPPRGKQSFYDGCGWKASLIFVMMVYDSFNKFTVFLIIISLFYRFKLYH
jgi:hypothetical protein